MKCHYTYEGKEKFWIPGCHQGFYSDGYCACRVHEKELQKQWKENDPEFKARNENKLLWKENARLMRIIDKILTHKK